MRHEILEPQLVGREASSASSFATTHGESLAGASPPAATSPSAVEARSLDESGQGGRLSPGCSIVVPVYRGRETLPLLVERLERVLTGLGGAFEIVLVNDGSPDNSWAVIQDLAQRYPAIRGINLMRNYGQHNATLCGLRQSRFDVTITMDDDLQHAPEDISKLLTKLSEGHDVVYGVWRERHQGFGRAFFAALTKRTVAWVMGTKNVRDIGAFRAIRTGVRQAFQSFDGNDVLLDVLLSWGTSRFAAVPVDEAERASGTSNYTLWKLIRVSLLVLTSYTTAPLRIANFIGLFFMLFGAAALVNVLYAYFWLGSVPGFSFLAATILIFGGVQLFALGIIGEYLARIFNRTAGRPPYTIGQTTR